MRLKIKKIYGDKGTLPCDVWKCDFTPAECLMKIPQRPKDPKARSHTKYSMCYNPL